MPDHTFQQIVMMLNQSLIATISDNFRMVTIDELGGGWEIVFYLWRENEEDREEIDDALGDFAGYIWPMKGSLRSQIIVTDEYLPLPLPPKGPTVVYMKRQ